MKNVAIVGFGHWGPNYLKCLQRLENVTVKYIVDPRFHADLFKDGIMYRSAATDVVLDKTVDAAIIATPATTHFDIAKIFLEAGKHLLVEKPLCTDFEQSLFIEELAFQNKCVLKVGHIFIHNLAVTKMKKLIDDGTLGRPLYGIARRTHLGLIRGDVNVVWDLAPHDISIFNHLFNSDPISVNASGQKHQGSEFEDVCFITLNYPDNISAQILVSWEDANKERTLSVMGNKARLLFDDLNQMEKLKIINKGLSRNLDNKGVGLFHTNLRDGDIFSPNIPPHEPLQIMVEDFIDSIMRQDIALTREGSTIVKIIQRIQQSIAENGTPINL